MNVPPHGNRWQPGHYKLPPLPGLILTIAHKSTLAEVHLVYELSFVEAQCSSGTGSSCFATKIPAEFESQPWPSEQSESAVQHGLCSCCAVLWHPAVLLLTASSAIPSSFCSSSEAKATAKASSGHPRDPLD